MRAFSSVVTLGGRDNDAPRRLGEPVRTEGCAPGAAIPRTRSGPPSCSVDQRPASRCPVAIS